jgi:hypothetical protein
MFGLFKKKKVENVVESDKLPEKNLDFSLEYYPLTNVYFAKYKNKYLAKNITTGFVNGNESYLIEYADKFKNKEDALKLIELFKEQRFKENVQVIKLNDY